MGSLKRMVVCAAAVAVCCAVAGADDDGIERGVLQLVCPSGAAFTLTTGTGNGECEIERDDEGAVVGGRCADDDGNAAEASCTLNGGEGSCTRTTGAGACDVVEPDDD